MNTCFNLTFINALKKFIALFLTGITVSISCSTSLTAHPDESDIPVPVSVNALMVTMIDHSAHYIWDYAALDDMMLEEEWLAIEYYSIQLAAAGPLITLGGTGELDNTWSLSPQWLGYSM